METIWIYCRWGAQGRAGTRRRCRRGWSRCTPAASGSVPDSIRPMDPDPVTHKSSKKLRNFMFWSAGCSFLRVEGFFCSLEIPYGGLGIGVTAVFDQKNVFIFFSAGTFFSFLGHQNPRYGSRLVFSLKCWIQIPIKSIWIRNTACRKGSLT